MNKIIRKTGLGSVAARIRILVISLLVMIIGLFLIYQRHQETLASTRIHASNRTRLNRYVDMMNEELTRSAVFISQQYLQQEIYIELENAGDDLSKYMCSCDVEELFQIFQTDSRYHQYIYAYCPANDVFVYSSSLSSEPPKKEDVAALAEKEFALREWQTAELNGAYCFYYTALLHETYPFYISTRVAPPRGPAVLQKSASTSRRSRQARARRPKPQRARRQATKA